MNRSENDLEYFLFWCWGGAAWRREGKLPGNPQAPWLVALIRRLELEVALSRSRQEFDSAGADFEHDEWIGSQQVAAMLRRDLRWVQRHAADIGGRKVAGQFVFQQGTVREYVEELNGDT